MDDFTFDDTLVVLRDSKTVHVAGHLETFGGSASFRRDVRLAHPTDAMLARVYWQADHKPQPGDLYCSDCGHMKPPDEFGADKTRKNGKCYVCRACRNEQRRRMYARFLGRAPRSYSVTTKY